MSKCVRTTPNLLKWLAARRGGRMYVCDYARVPPPPTHASVGFVRNLHEQHIFNRFFFARVCAFVLSHTRTVRANLNENPSTVHAAAPAFRTPDAASRPAGFCIYCFRSRADESLKSATEFKAASGWAHQQPIGLSSRCDLEYWHWPARVGSAGGLKLSTHMPATSTVRSIEFVRSPEYTQSVRPDVGRGRGGKKIKRRASICHKC